MSDQPEVTEIRTESDALIAAVRTSTLNESVVNDFQHTLLMAASATPRVPIILDLSDVEFAPSVALGALVKLTKTLKLEGRRLLLVGIRPRLRGVITVTQLHKLLEIGESVNDALALIRGTPRAGGTRRANPERK